MSDEDNNHKRSMSTVTLLGAAGLNFQDWDDDFKTALGMKKIQRYVERKEDATPKKPKPAKKATETEEEYEKRLEKWEDEVNMVLGIMRKSLGDHRTIIKGVKDPLDAYETVMKQYSGETEYDIIDLMQRFTLSKPKGNDLLGYITEMEHLQKTLDGLSIKYSDAQLIGTMLIALKDYEVNHPFRALYNDLSFKYKDKPAEVTMNLFRRFAKSTIRDLTLDVRNAADSVKSELDAGSALAIKNGKARYLPSTYCRFCKSTEHKYDVCKDPKFDPDWREKQKALEKTSSQKTSRGDGKPIGRANVVEYDDADDSEISIYSPSTVLAVLQPPETDTTHRATAFLDSGSSWSILSDRQIFKHCARPRPTQTGVIVGNGAKLQAEVMGDVLVHIGDECNKIPVVLKNCLFIPGLCTNLISVGRLLDDGYSVNFMDNQAKIIHPSGRSITIQQHRALYPISIDGAKLSDFTLAVITPDIWHQRLGHISRPLVTPIELDGTIINVDGEGCEACPEGKSKRSSHPRSDSIAEDILDLLHIDIAGPSTVDSLHRGRYFLIIVDDHSRFYHVSILKHKSDAFAAVKKFVHLHENRTGKRVKCIRSDRGGEFLGAEWEPWLAEKGIARHTTSPHSAQQNGRAERAIGVIKTGALVSLLHANLPAHYWAAAIRAFTYVRNKTYTTHDRERSPHEIFYGKAPDYGHLRVFGCIAWAHIPKATRKPWEPRAKKCILVGYGQDENLSTKGYILWDPREKRKIVTPHVTFWETKFWRTRDGNESVPYFMTETPDSGPVPDHRFIELPEEELEDFEEAAEQAIQPEAPRVPEQAPQQPEEQQPERRPARERQRPRALNDYVTYLADTNQDVHQQSLDEILDNCFALSAISDNVDEYADAKSEEMRSMAKHKVWTLVPDEGQKVIGSRFVLSEKIDANDIIMKKARLIAQGFGQILGIDCNEIFSPVVKLESLRTLLALATREGLCLLQGDVKTAYLYSPIEEMVYMRQPRGYEEPGKERWICKLEKSIYGLRQSARNWNIKLTAILSGAGFTPTLSEPSLFTKTSSLGKIVGMMAVYVDDLLVAGTPQVLKDIREHMDRKLTMKWNDNPRLILGLQLERDHHGNLQISQRRFIDGILAEFDMSSCTPTKLPIKENLPFPQTDRSSPDTTIPFLECIGKLNWLARGTRPDIAFAVSHFARFCSCYQSQHWDACMHLIWYLQGTKETYIEYRRSGTPTVEGYSDADWAQNRDDRKSVTGYLFTLAGGPIAWSSKGQATVALSTCEAEYVALGATGREALWLRSLLTELGRPLLKPIIIHEDNDAARKSVENPVFHSRMKHIDVTHHAIRQWSAEGKIKMVRLDTTSMLADMLTKPLPGTRIANLSRMAGLQLVVKR